MEVILSVVITVRGEGTIIMPLLFFAEKSETFIHYKIFFKKSANFSFSVLICIHVNLNYNMSPGIMIWSWIFKIHFSYRSL